MSPVRIILAGLLLSQLFFALLVFRSNTELLDRLAAIAAAGYQPVPNTAVMAGLDSFLPAFCGGLFFTLTLGAGLSFASFILICLWHDPGRRHLLGLLPLLLLWALAVVQALDTDYPLLLGAFFLFIPPFVSVLTCKWLNENYPRSAGFSFFSSTRLIRRGLLHAAVISGILLVWLPNFNAGVFVNIRDQLLLNNPAGGWVNDFYYTYTLYPAELIKTLRQKQLKTSRIRVKEPELSARLAKTLRRLDYLPLKQNGPVDLLLRRSGRRLLLCHQDRTIMETSPARFLNAPESLLNKFSRKTDRMDFLRQTTLFSLVAAAPLLLYILIHGIFKTLLFFFMRTRRFARTGSGLICLGIAAVLAMPLYPFAKSTSSNLNRRQLAVHLDSEQPAERLRALKQMAASSSAPLPLPAPVFRLKDSPWPAERYWAAKVMGRADSQKAEKVLRMMLSDPHPNVVCAAISSLARIHDPAAVPVLRKILVSSDYWYIQLYAYKGLKELGWSQPESV